MTYYDDERVQEEADRKIARWSKNKKDFQTVRHRMGEIVRTDINLIQSGRQGLGTIRDGDIDLDHAYQLAKLTVPETRAEIRRAERRERSYEPPADRRDPNSPTVRQTILRSMREVEERN